MSEYRERNMESQRVAREAHAEAEERKAEKARSFVPETRDSSAPNLQQRISKIAELGIVGGIGVTVETEAGMQDGEVIEIDFETGRVWVRGISPDPGHPSKATLCNPFAIRAVHEATKKLEK